MESRVLQPSKSENAAAASGPSGATGGDGGIGRFV